MDQHRKDIKAVLRALLEAKIKLKPTKCEFHQQETKYLGFIVNPEGVRADPVKTSAIDVWQPPKSVKGVQSFLGFCNFYRRFIEGFSRIAKPLYDTTKKDTKWEWKEKQQEGFDELRKRLTTAPILQHFKPELPIMIETDGSNYVCSEILSQLGTDGLWRRVAFRSKTRSKAECNYDIHDKELLAIVQALKAWRKYALGSQEDI